MKIFKSIILSTHLGCINSLVVKKVTEEKSKPPNLILNVIS